MGTSVAAVKAALVRARANIAAHDAPGAAPVVVADLERLRRYSDLFNTRDWDGLRALFVEETRLDVVSRYQRRGPSAAVDWRDDGIAQIRDFRYVPHIGNEASFTRFSSP
jgi:hypothetical protein